MEIHNFDMQGPNRIDMIAYTNGYREEVETGFMRTWRLKSEIQQKSLVGFTKYLRIFCVASTDKETLWEEFALVKQTVNRVVRPTQIVANELKVLEMRVSELSTKQ